MKEIMRTVDLTLRHLRRKVRSVRQEATSQFDSKLLVLTRYSKCADLDLGRAGVYGVVNRMHESDFATLLLQFCEYCRRNQKASLV